MQTQPIQEPPRNEMVPVQEVGFDWRLLGNILRRQARLWVTMTLLLWVGLLLLCLLLVPRAFTTTASIALQQSPGAGGALGALAGLAGSATKTYDGVIRSHRFALSAARTTHIQALYHLRTEDEAADMLQKGVSLADKQDGLLYLTVALPGPPKLAFGQGSHIQQIRDTVPLVASAYIRLLSHYLATTNTNRDASLLREAQKQLVKARVNYELSVGDLGRVVNASPSSAPLSSGTALSSSSSSSLGTAKASGGSGDASDAMGQLSSLYATKARLEGEIAAGNALTQGTAALASGSTQSLSALPGEDPLLQEARHQVTQASVQLQNLRIELSDDNPEVVAARQRLRIAQARLRSESSALRQGRTSDTVRQTALKAQYATVLSQVAAAERTFVIGRGTSMTVEKYRNEMMLRLEVLKTTATQFAMLSLQKGAGNNLMDVIDTPQIPKSGQPGAAMLALLCFFAALFLTQVTLAAAYCLQWYRRSLPAV